ncbi:hypothetical protein KEM55_002434, partial [Ascosphaera atra]
MRLNRGYDTDSDGSEEAEDEEKGEEEQRGRSREDITKHEPADKAIVKEEPTRAPPLSAHRGHEEQRRSWSSDTSSSSSSSPGPGSNASPSSDTSSDSDSGDSERIGRSVQEDEGEGGSESRGYDRGGGGGVGGSTPLVASTPIKREPMSARPFEIRVPSARRYAAGSGEGEHGRGSGKQSSQEIGGEGNAQSSQGESAQGKGRGIFVSDSESRSQESQIGGGRDDEGEEHHEQDQTHEDTPPAEQTQPTSGPRRPGDSDVDMPDISRGESPNPLQRVLDGIAAVGLSSFESTQDNQVARLPTQSRELQTQDREQSVDDDYDADYISVYGDSDEDNDSDALQVLGGGNIALRHKLDAMRAAQPGSNDRKAELYKQYLTHFHCVLPIYDNKQCGPHEHYGIKNAATDPHADGIALLVRDYLAAALGALAISPFDAEAAAWFNAANAAFVPDGSDAGGETFTSHCHPVHEVQILLLKTQYYLALMRSHKGWEAVATAI